MHLVILMVVNFIANVHVVIIIINIIMKYKTKIKVTLYNKETTPTLSVREKDINVVRDYLALV